VEKAKQILLPVVLLDIKKNMSMKEEKEGEKKYLLVFYESSL
jgi:hypothetical protein